MHCAEPSSTPALIEVGFPTPMSSELMVPPHRPTTPHPLAPPISPKYPSPMVAKQPPTLCCCSLMLLMLLIGGCRPVPSDAELDPKKWSVGRAPGTSQHGDAGVVEPLLATWLSDVTCERGLAFRSLILSAHYFATRIGERVVVPVAAVAAGDNGFLIVFVVHETPAAGPLSYDEDAGESFTLDEVVFRETGIRPGMLQWRDGSPSQSRDEMVLRPPPKSAKVDTGSEIITVVGIVAEFRDNYSELGFGEFIRLNLFNMRHLCAAAYDKHTTPPIVRSFVQVGDIAHIPFFTTD